MGGTAEAERRICEASRTSSNWLDLASLNLRHIPESIKEIKRLKWLHLNNNRFSRLPEAVFTFPELRWLSIENNLISKLPENLGDLTNLEGLNLRGNRLSAVPDSIGALGCLEGLNLRGNQLVELPESIGRLEHLEGLYLHDNKLVALPENIGATISLKCLCLENNRLASLPRNLGDLKSLEQLYLHGNPALDIPPEELGPTWIEVCSSKDRPRQASEILDYHFRTRKLEKRALNEAKLILVGRGGVGKTSLRKRLIAGEWDEQEDKTAGIQVTSWPLTLGREHVKLNVWDFGGQEIMHATHQFFLTRRSLYVLVLNAREGKQDANIDYWLRLIGAYGGGSPTLVVVNKCDQHPLDLTEQTLREKFPFIREFIRTDCKTIEGLADLRSAIERETSALPDLRTAFPKAWFSLKQKLEALPVDCITYDDYRKLCDDNEERDDANQQILIGFLHDLGTVLHFRDDPRLNDLGVLKPAWVTDGIYSLLNASELSSSGGTLQTSRLSALLDSGKYPRHRHDFLLRLMEKFELCFELLHTGGAKFLIPELLNEEPKKLPKWDVDTLGFEYHFNILPEGLLPRFIVRTHTLSEVGPRWRSGVVLRKGRAEALVRADVQDRRVWIAVRGPGRQPRDLLALIRGHFDEIHRGISGLIADERVPVVGYPQVKLDYRKLLVREANGKTTVEFETETESIELKLGKLLDNFETKSSRDERAQFIKIEAGGRLIMPNEHYDFSGAHISNSVVGAHMQNISSIIKQHTNGVRLELLENVLREAINLIARLPTDQQEQAAENLELLVKGADESKPNRRWYSVSADGLLDASKFAKDFAGNLAGTIGQLGKAIWPDFTFSEPNPDP